MMSGFPATERGRAMRRLYYRGNRAPYTEEQIQAEIDRPRYKPGAASEPERHSVVTRAASMNERAEKLGIPGRVTPRELTVKVNESGGLCYYCGQRFGASLEFDHYIPVSRGGDNTIENIRCACHQCNSDKRDSMPNEWLPSRNRPAHLAEIVGGKKTAILANEYDSCYPVTQGGFIISEAIAVGCEICGGTMTKDGEDNTVICDDGIDRCVTCYRAAPDTTAFPPDMMVYGDIGEDPFSDVVYVPYDYPKEDLRFD